MADLMLFAGNFCPRMGDGLRMIVFMLFVGAFGPWMRDGLVMFEFLLFMGVHGPGMGNTWCFAVGCYSRLPGGMVCVCLRWSCNEAVFCVIQGIYVLSCVTVSMTLVFNNVTAWLGYWRYDGAVNVCVVSFWWEEESVLTWCQSSEFLGSVSSVVVFFLQSFPFYQEVSFFFHVHLCWGHTRLIIHPVVQYLMKSCGDQLCLIWGRKEGFYCLFLCFASGEGFLDSFNVSVNKTIGLWVVRLYAVCIVTFSDVKDWPFSVYNHLAGSYWANSHWNFSVVVSAVFGVSNRNGYLLKVPHINRKSQWSNVKISTAFSCQGPSGASLVIIGWVACDALCCV